MELVEVNTPVYPFIHRLIENEIHTVITCCTCFNNVTQYCMPFHQHFLHPCGKDWYVIREIIQPQFKKANSTSANSTLVHCILFCFLCRRLFSIFISIALSLPFLSRLPYCYKTKISALVSHTPIPIPLSLISYFILHSHVFIPHT